MSERFEACLAKILQYEGGFTEGVGDPGGATNLGISLRYARSQGSMLDLNGDGVVDRSDILLVTPETAKVVYQNWFWKDVRGEDLPAGVDLAVFDFAVNSGGGRAVRFLQEVLGVTADGVFGPQTLAAVKKADAASVVNDLCRRRLAWLQTLAVWPRFKNGWSIRVSDVQNTALEMVGNPRMSVQEATGTDTGKAAITTSVIAGVATAAANAEPVIKALGSLTPWVALAVIVAALVGVLIWRTKR